MLKPSHSDSLRQQIEAIRQYLSKLKGIGVKKIGIFGSYATGNSVEGSDLDILIEFKENENTYDNLLNVHSLLKKLFVQKIDLVTIDGLSPFVKDVVLDEVVYVEESS